MYEIIRDCETGADPRQALVLSRQRPDLHLQNIFRSTYGIVFLGTPHHGAGLAKWAALFSQAVGIIQQINKEIVDILRRDSEVLARIQDSFHTMIRIRHGEGLQPIEITCFYEQLPMGNFDLVSWSCQVLWSSGNMLTCLYI
jgi:protein SERAC1